ncbi:MAG TPA: hypothetical protein VFE91_01045 [Nitrososphaerales archaeon]|nr:hypothetical protein [Nitrososphaerales archaeon]
MSRAGNLLSLLTGFLAIYIGYYVLQSQQFGQNSTLFAILYFAIGGFIVYRFYTDRGGL